MLLMSILNQDSHGMTQCTCTSVTPKSTEDITSSLGHQWSGSSSYGYCSLFVFILMMGFRELTMTFFLAVIADRRHITPRLNFTNVAALNYLLRSEIFVSKDQQLRAVHLILDFEPISRTFQEIGHDIRAGDPRNKPYRRIQARFLSSRRFSSRHTSHSANPSSARNSLATSTS